MRSLRRILALLRRAWRSQWLLGLLMGATMTLSACAWWMAGRGGSYGGDEIIMSHAGHMDTGALCADCHGAVAESEDLSRSFRPTEAACLECHDRDECEKCHTDVSKRTPTAAPAPANEGAAALVSLAPREAHLDFSHKNHLGRVGEQACAACHAEAVESTALPVPVMRMQVCESCHLHAEQVANAQCNQCHRDLQTKPLVALAGLRHGGDFMRRHGMLARTAGTTCLQCHRETTCTDCHSQVAPAVPPRLYPDQVDRPQIHRGDFLTSHGMEARSDPATCLRCHARDEAQFCGNCHTAYGLTDKSSTGFNPHPPGFAMRGSGAFHGDEARLNPAACAACHDQGAASACATCHRSGGIGGNPHPPGFAMRHPRQEIASNAMCRHCHLSP